VIATVQAVLADAGIPARLFAGVHPNPTTDDLAAGADGLRRLVRSLWRVRWEKHADHRNR
jgi:alcohol dehydrogenase class IV